MCLNELSDNEYNEHMQDTGYTLYIIQIEFVYLLLLIVLSIGVDDIRDGLVILTSRKNVMYGCPMAWQSPILARMTSLNGFLTPCTTKEEEKKIILNYLYVFFVAANEKKNDYSLFWLYLTITYLHVCALCMDTDCSRSSIYFFSSSLSSC